jgi:hypothetical protein
MALHPVGPLPASVYWRRRLVLLVVLVAVVVLLRSCVGDGGGQTPAGKTSSPSPTTSARAGGSPTPTRSPARTGPVTCADAVLRLAVTSDLRSYPQGTTPRFTVRVTNTSSTPCRRDLGGKQVELRVYSGEDRIWSSDDCGDTDGRLVQTIGAKSYLETVMTWPGTRSRPGCAGERPRVQPGTYYVRLRVGTLSARGAVFQVRRA